ncbi:hypothetical protein KOR42_46920 [Thalassoglobus neptunius]|uniref:Uncharacterized protein n=2 Tax=Thalassoglobus neptunius TaxID=1938619 RepID=A0A5C5VXA7_9PLAN|nr:hypothetical protein KOR42_46920 [Thalassoglobus neptunius]
MFNGLLDSNTGDDRSLKVADRLHFNGHCQFSASHKTSVEKSPETWRPEFCSRNILELRFLLAHVCP